MDKLNKIKVLRDPVHSYIHVELAVIWDCINAKEFQRLRRIKQLGGAFQVYHSAEHSRFSHSLGVYEIVRRMVSEVQDIKDALSEYDKTVVMLAGLLHDLGHAPFSHAFEAISNKKHEVVTLDIIAGDSEVNRCLKACHPDIVKDVCSVIAKKHPNIILNQMVSSQLDADRMDYLLRDAYFTGTQYGAFDIERLLRTMRVHQQRLMIKESGIHSVEDYIMARYHMYWQVYFHPTSRAFEKMLTSLFRRLKFIANTSPELIEGIVVFNPVLKQTDISIDDHYLFDESACLYGFTQLSMCGDPILKDLASRLLERRLFKYEDLKSDLDYQNRAIKAQKIGFDPEYYLDKDNALQRPYDPYSIDSGEGIWILMRDDTEKEISEASVIVKALIHAEEKQDAKMYFPKECLE